MLFRLNSLFEEDILDHTMLDIVSESGLDDIIDELNESFVDDRIHLFENTEDMDKMKKNVSDVNTGDETEDILDYLGYDDIIDYVESEDN